VGEKHPDLVVLDIMLPEMDGWEVCRRLRQESDVPVIMLTARGEDVDRIVGLELGADMPAWVESEIEQFRHQGWINVP